MCYYSHVRHVMLDVNLVLWQISHTLLSEIYTFLSEIQCMLPFYYHQALRTYNQVSASAISYLSLMAFFREEINLYILLLITGADYVAIIRGLYNASSFSRAASPYYYDNLGLTSQ